MTYIATTTMVHEMGEDGIRKDFMEELRKLGGVRYGELKDSGRDKLVAELICSDVRLSSDKAQKNIKCRYEYDTQCNKLYRINRTGKRFYMMVKLSD